jgi:hypothetical protein
VSDLQAFTAAQEILFAAAELDEEVGSFSEWDLTVRVWQRNPNRFGCRGYETMYPDHKRVMKEIMSSSVGNPLRRGWLERTSPNRYRLTNVGRSEFQRQSRRTDEGRNTVASPQSIYDAVVPFYRSSVFQKHLRDAAEPRLWLSAASFLELANSDRQHFEDRLIRARASIEGAVEWLDHHRKDKITRGVTGGSEAIHRDSLIRLGKFLELLESRFANQIQAIRSRP